MMFILFSPLRSNAGSGWVLQAWWTTGVAPWGLWRHVVPDLEVWFPERTLFHQAIDSRIKAGSKWTPWIPWVIYHRISTSPIGKHLGIGHAPSLFLIAREYILSIQLARNLEVLKAEDEDEEPEEQKPLVSGTPKAVECLGWLTVHGMIYDVHGIFLQSKRIHCMGCLFATGRKVTPMWPLQDFCMYLKSCTWLLPRFFLRRCHLHA